jgi:hypothetical protein
MRTIAGLGAFAVTLLAGCGGGGDGGGAAKGLQRTRDAYSQRVLEARARMERPLVGLSITAVNGAREQARGLHTEAVLAERYADELDGIEPPPDVATAHHEFATGWHGWARDYERAAARAARGHDPLGDPGDITLASTSRHLAHARRVLRPKGYRF